MATKTSSTKETVLKTKTAAPSAEKKGTTKTVVSASVPKLTEASKPSKTVSKAKTKLTDAAQETKQKTISEPAEKPAQSAVSMAPVVSMDTSVQAQDKKWLEIRLILEKLKEDTLREIRKSVKNGTEAVAAIEPGGDIYDQASSERDRELGLLLGDREREKIHSIDEALLRIDDGEYGVCEECDEDIPLGRLKAMPFTRHCVKCKSDLEKLQAQTKRVEEERAYREIPIGSEDEE
jgi:DnaK suppressor protein